MVNFLLTKNKRKVNIIILFAKLKNSKLKPSSISAAATKKKEIWNMYLKYDVTLKFKKENIGKAVNRI